MAHPLGYLGKEESLLKEICYTFICLIVLQKYNDHLKHDIFKQFILKLIVYIYFHLFYK